MVMAGRRILITGATDGLGRALAFALAVDGDTLIVHGRDPARVAALVEELKPIRPEVAGCVADFTSLDAIRGMAADLVERRRFDVLVNNAGLGMGGARSETPDGFEAVFQVNCIAGDLLARLCLPLLRRGDDPRVVNVASAAQAPLSFADLQMTSGWSGPFAYGRSKLAQVMSSMDLAERFGDSGVAVNALHPASLMPTKLVIGLFEPASTLGDGVRAVRHLIDLERRRSGEYFSGLTPARAHEQAYDPVARKALRDWLDTHAPSGRGGH
jgi:NAD(P)-dependent dehydrogenase (short-subunit alcohol dehydrogenase family)